MSNSISTTASKSTANPKYQPKTPSQIEYVNALLNPDTKLIVAVGPAGTGKSLFACSNAIQSLKKKQIEKIILTRPLVSVADEDIGFLPGNLNSKMSIWVQPMMDIFMEHMNKKDIANLIQSNVIEITPLMYMRGRTFKNTIIIADEIQNTTPQQLLMLLTRCGENSKIIVTGDENQSDLKEKNGLSDFIERFESAKMMPPDLIKLIQFNSADVQRSELVKQVLSIYFQPQTETQEQTQTPNTETPTPNTEQSVSAQEQSVSAQEQTQTPVTATNAVHASTFEKDLTYMKWVNDRASKIPSEYGDYIYCIEQDKTADIIENDCALIPKHLMR
jgi:phosphate starvation-inducible PhoH-like protein